MQIAIDLAGFTGSQADDMRRACGKKNRGRMNEHRERFVDGAMEGGTPRDVGAAIWGSLIERASDWSFNRAHAVAYALIGYRMAWLKAHHPGAFAAALEESRR